ncbi:glutaredoxin [Actinomyces sp. oral taxon 180 str. F0310]|nr:glutaredoxin [Actinomyces sp. oral taxon 180 str. F0310]
MVFAANEPHENVQTKQTSGPWPQGDTNMSITVYSKPRCPQCDATYRALDKQGVSYERIDVTQDPESLAFIKGLGYQQAPVVVAGEDHWSGFRPDRIKAVAAAGAPLALQA